EVKNTGIQLGGNVYDEFTGRKVSGAIVRLRHKKTERGKLESDGRGGYEFNVSPGLSYELVVDKPGYKRRIVSADIGDLKYPAAVKVDIPLEDTLQLKLVVQVINKESRAPLNNSRVMVYNKCTNVNTELPTDEDGILRIRLEPNCTFYLAGRRLGFLDDNDVVNTSGLTESSELASVLELTEIKEDLVIELKNIYYDYGRYYIREDAVEDLDNLSALMAQYPSLKIEISSHTDARGSDETNHTLSQKRAETCVDYLALKGIPRDKLVARGYGEYLLKNDCSNGINCSEEQHQINRRTEFKVLSFDQVLYSDDVDNPAVNIYKKVFGDDEVIRTPKEISIGDDVPSVVFIQRDDGDENIRTSSGLLDKQNNAFRDMVSDVAADHVNIVSPKVNTESSVISTPDPVDLAKENSDNVIVNTNPVKEDPIIQTPINVPNNYSNSDLGNPLNSGSDAVDLNELIGEEKANQYAEESAWWTSGVSYSVQLSFGSSSTSAFKGHSDLGNIRLEKSTSGSDVVILGYFKKFSEANSILATLRSRGVKDAFIVSYVDGERLE
ncbi:MAG: outer membrane protein OmpA-like peptidoglycan-associated protein, partial [Limisphaerales bacterium]